MGVLPRSLEATRFGFWLFQSLWHNTIELKDYRNPLHLDVVDRYLRRMGDKTIPDEAPPSLESFYPPWVAGIRKLLLNACVVMVTTWRLFAMQSNACHPLRLKPYGYVQKISNRVVYLSIYDIFVSGILCCVCLYAHKSRLVLLDN